MSAPANIEALRPVAEAFESLGIDYYIGGSTASSFHGRGRSTADIDIVAIVKASHVANLVARLEAAYYIDSEMIHDAIQNLSSFNLIHRATSYKIDVFQPSNGLFHRSVRRRLVNGALPGDPDRSFPIASAEDTILSKLVWYRMGGESSNQQWSDVQGVIRVQRDRLDMAYLKSWAADMGVRDLIDRAMYESGV